MVKGFTYMYFCHTNLPSHTDELHSMYNVKGTQYGKKVYHWVLPHLPRGAVSLCEWCHSSWMQRPPFSSRPAHGSPRTSQHRHYQRQRRGWCWWTAGWLTAWSSALHGQYPHHHGCWTPVFQQQKAWTHINAAILDATLSWEDKGLVTRVQIFGLDPESWSDQWNHKPFVILIHSSSTSVRLRIWVCHQTLFLVRGWVWAWRWSYDLVSWSHTIFCCPVYHSISQYTTVYHSIPQYTTVYHSIPLYHIAGNFRGRKLSQILQFCGYSCKLFPRNLGVWCLLHGTSKQSTKIVFSPSFLPW